MIEQCIRPFSFRQLDEINFYSKELILGKLECGCNYTSSTIFCIVVNGKCLNRLFIYNVRSNWSFQLPFTYPGLISM